MQRVKLFVRNNKVALLLAALPFTALVLFLVYTTVNTPFWDQWELVPIIRNVNEGHWYFHDFWQQHNEHRLFFPRLVMITAALITNWNVRVESLINVGLALVSFALLLAAMLKLESGPVKKLNPVLTFILALIWFSPVQSENWLWGWQIQWYLNVVGVMAVILGLVSVLKKGLSWSNGVLLVGAIWLAQLSLGNGVLLWPIVLLALAYLKQPLKRVGAVLAAGIVLNTLYYLNYSDTPGNTSKAAAFLHPRSATRYIFEYIGRPLSYVGFISLLCGLVLTSLFLLVCWRLFKYKNTQFRKMVPFIALGLYGFASAFITTLSRVGLGIAQALSSRYTTISSLILVSFILICYFSWPSLKTTKLGSIKQLPLIALTSLVFLTGLNYQFGINMALTQHQYLKDIKNCTHQVAPEDICLRSTYPNKDTVAPRLEYLKQIHWGGF